MMSEATLSSPTRLLGLSIAILFVVITVTAISAAQPVTSIPPLRVSEFRPVGQERVWTFEGPDSVGGRLSSTTAGPSQIGSVSGMGISEDLSMRLSGGRSMAITSLHLVDEEGRYLGDRMGISSGGQLDSLQLVRSGDSLVGFVTRGGQKESTSAYCPATWSAWDLLFVDQVELYLATHGVTVGQKIDDTVFAPHPMLAVPIKGEVVTFTRVSLYNQLYDSAFAIGLTEPQPVKLLFTKDRRLVKAEFTQQGIKVYQDAISKVRAATTPTAPRIPMAVIVGRVPSYLILLAVSVLVLLFFAGFKIRWNVGYLMFAISAIVFWLIPYTQVPLQEAFIAKKLLPAVKAGDSIYLWGIWPALIAGIVQTILIGGLITSMGRSFKLSSERSAVLGAVCGAGFGLMEACYFVATVPFFSIASYGMLERVFILIFHISAGLLLGLGLKRGVAIFLQTALLLALVNASLRYFPVFAQQRLFGPELLSVILALLSLATVLVALVQGKRHKADHVPSHH